GLAECTWSIEEQTISIHVTVPPNSTAIVHLPGAEEQPLEVTAGTHSWSYPYRDPDVRPPLSIDDPIGEIADYPGAWDAVMESLMRLSPRSHFPRYGLRTQKKTSLRDALANLPNADEILSDISGAFSRL